MKMMKTAAMTGLAAFAAIVMIAPAGAADLMGGSLKDDPMVQAPARSSCYVRGDIGYGWSKDADAYYWGNATQENFDSADLGDAGFGELGFGCGSGVRGLRADLTFGWHGDKDFEGHIPLTVPDDPITTSVRSMTSLVNVYYDLGDWGGWVPYVGAGVGAAFHQMDMVYATDPSSPNPQFGDDTFDLAWQVSTGVGYRLTDSMMLDFGYRYLDMGSARSNSVDLALENNPILETDVAEHEIKAGIRIDLSGMY